MGRGRHSWCSRILQFYLHSLIKKKMSCSSTVQSIVAAKVNYFGDLKELGLLGWMGNTGLMARDLEGWSKEPAKKDGIQRGVHKEVFWKYVLPALSGVAGLSGVLEYFVLFVHDVYFRSFSVTHALNGILLLTASVTISHNQNEPILMRPSAQTHTITSPHHTCCLTTTPKIATRDRKDVNSHDGGVWAG